MTDLHGANRASQVVETLAAAILAAVEEHPAIGPLREIAVASRLHAVLGGCHTALREAAATITPGCTGRRSRFLLASDRGTGHFGRPIISSKFNNLSTQFLRPPVPSPLR